MPPKAEDQDILVHHGEDFRENWLEYHEDSLLDQLRDEFFNRNCHYCGEEYPTALKCFCHERFCKEEKTTNKRFTCRVTNCGINFKTMQGLTQHKKRHRKPGGYVCFLCDAQFTSESARMEHRMVTHRIYQCQICLIKYESSTDYVTHILTIHNVADEPRIEMLKEELIDDETVVVDEQQLQSQNDDPLINMKCEPIAETHFIVNFNQVELKKEEHEEEETHFEDLDHGLTLQSDSDADNQIEGAQSDKKATGKSKRHTCDVCNKSLCTSSSLKRHKEQTCKGRFQKLSLPRCKNCRAFFENAELLKKHADTCTVTCATCNNVLSNKKNLLRHIRTIHNTRRNEKIFKYCNKCDRKFISKLDLEQHISSDCGKKFNYECPVCKKAFPLERKMRTHVKFVHTEKRYKCQYCEKPFRGTALLKLHEQMEHKGKSRKSDTFNCHLCPGTYTVERTYMKHLELMHGVKVESSIGVHSCDYCKRMFLTKERLAGHMKRIHTINNKIQIKCTDCSKTFDDKASMHAHRIVEHKDKYVCHLCDKTFKASQSLPNHIKTRHEKEKVAYRNLYLCGKCGKSFRNRVAHQDHEEANCGRSFRYQCDVCKKNLATLGTLKSHKLTHTNIKPFSCSYCEKSFRTANEKGSHERSHTGLRPYTCTYCSKTFGHYGTLTTHLTVHTGFKRYMCSGCGQRFTCLSNLRVHRKSHAATCGLVPNNTKPLEPTDERMKVKDPMNDEEDE